MAAAASLQYSTIAGRSNTFDTVPGPRSAASTYGTPGIASAGSSQRKLTLLTSSKSLGHGSRGSPTTTSPSSYKDSGVRPTLKHIGSDMSSYTSTTTIPAATRNDSKVGKLHKRNSSGNSLPATPSPLGAPYSTFDVPYPSNSTPKTKPYLRKLSSTKDDHNQGRLDLSKSTSENVGALAGLGIHDFGNRSASDVTFSPAGRRTPHMRTTSVGSQVSTASGSYRPSGTFVHPMRQTPTTHSYASSMADASMNEDEARESTDFVTEDESFQLPSFRGRRSISVSSTPQNQPTPLSQSHTAEDLGIVPKLTTSHSNLSFHSIKSESSKKQQGRSRGNTNRSASDFQGANSPSSRNSFDRALSFASIRPEPRPLNSKEADEKVREARRKFKEERDRKEAKYAQEALRKQQKTEMKEEKQRRKSEASERRPGSSHGRNITGKRQQHETRPGSREPANATALPDQHVSEKTLRVQQTTSEKQSGWQKFVKAMSCGG